MEDQNLEKEIKRILQLGYYSVHPDVVGSGAQRVDGQWYMPRWGTDTFQHLKDTFNK